MNKIGFNYSTILNGIFLLVGMVVYWLYRSKDRSSANDFAQDPTCGMQVRKSDAPASVEFDGEMFYFCMEGCKEEFLREKAKSA